MTARVFNSGYAPTLSDLKSNVRMTGTDLDDLLESKLKAAIWNAEHFIGRIIAQSTFTDTRSLVYSVELHAEVTSLTSVKVDGESLSSSQYSLSDNVLTIDDTVTGSLLEVVYVAGMTYVPDDIAAAVILHATDLFLNPSDHVETLPKASQNLLRPYRTYGL